MFYFVKEITHAPQRKSYICGFHPILNKTQLLSKINSLTFLEYLIGLLRATAFACPGIIGAACENLFHARHPVFLRLYYSSFSRGARANADKACLTANWANDF